MIMRSNELLTISGRRGYGKSTLAMSLISNLTRKEVWDPLAEFGGYQPQNGSSEEFEAWLKPIFIRGNCFIMVDEADLVLPVRKPLGPYAYKLVNIGRHRNLGLGMVTRRIAELNKTAFSQSESIYLFKHSIPNDIKYLAEFIDGVEVVRTFEKYQYAVFRM